MRAPSGSLLVLVLAACVAARTDEPADGLPLGQTLIIPLPSAMLTPGEQPLAEFYQGLLARLQLAYGERDLPTIHALLAGYRRDDAPPWARQAMDGFITLAEGLAFEQHVTATGSVTPPAWPPPHGAPRRRPPHP